MLSTEQVFAILDDDLAVADVELDALNAGAGNYAGASFTIARSGGANAQDGFAFAASVGFTVAGGALQAGGETFATFTATGGTLIINFTSAAATTELVEDVLQHVTYANQSDAPPPVVTLDYTFNDGNGAGAQGLGGALTDASDNEIVVGIVTANDAPTDIALANASVVEDSANGTVVGMLSGTDPDVTDTLTFRLIDNADARFIVIGNNLVVANGTLLDFEQNASHDVTVEVEDAGGLTHEETFTINVTKANAAPSDIALTNTSVAESSANGTVVGDLTGTDPDAGDSLTFTLADDAGGRFAINANQLLIANAALLNFEAAGSHQVTVRATDTGGLAFDETFAINLTNANEAPTDIALSNMNVAENSANGTVVGTFSGTDPDAGDTPVFTLLANAGGRFAISGNRLVVANRALLDFEQGSAHDVVVRMTDAGGLPRQETFTIAIGNVDPETVTGTSAADTIFGGALGDTLRGVAGNDTLRGLAGNDRLDGGTHNDRLFGDAGIDALVGGAGNDLLDGGASNDVLTGGVGRDILTGGLGADRFDFNSVVESRPGSARDIVNFVRAQRDKINLRDIDADTDGTAGNQAFCFIGAAGFHGIDGELRFAGGVLQGDTNGDRVADLEIRVVGALVSGDIIL